MKRYTKSSIGILLFLVVVAGIFFNRQRIRDQYIVKTTQLQPSSQALGQDMSLTNAADFTYRASQPAIEQADQFNGACRGVQREKSIVLGCYTQQKIYVYDVKDQRLNGVKQVTAAHELLHALYQRMSSKEKTDVNTLLEATAKTISDQRFKDTMAEYARTEPDQIDNELHSIIGTEVTTIPPALEAHYQKYFSDRQKIVNYSKQYEQTFTGLDADIKKYDDQLAILKARKDVLEKILATEQANIDTESNRLDTLRATSPQNYNQAVPTYNAKIKQYNADVAELKQVVADYNTIVEKRNTLATTQNDLAQQLDSNYQPLQ